MKIVISSGHGKYVRGASGYIDEVNEARKVVEEVAKMLRTAGVETTTYHDDVSHSQNENLNRIVDFHNSKTRDLDVSVHFNAYQTTQGPMGCEVLYVSSSGYDKAKPTVDAICGASGLINRGPKKRTDLFFLNNTEEPAILIETCFVDSRADVDIYHRLFVEICDAIASTLAGHEIPEEPVEPEEPPEPPVDEESEAERVIAAMAAKSAVASYNWKDRGRAPVGYIKGFALAWAQIVVKYDEEDAVAEEMAKGNTHNNDIDVLSWYNAEFQKLGMSNEVSGIETLRHLFVLLMGLGMRESSGRHCEGRDLSAENVQSDTAEAGLYQTSYNAHSCCTEFDILMTQYASGTMWKGYMDYFAEDVACSASEWENYGSGKGMEFQRLCKAQPAFAMESAALTLRNRRQHYGPINRKEAEVIKEAEWLLENVQRYVQGENVEA